MLKIWGRATSSNVQKVLWCCGELDIPFERVDLGGPFGGNQDPEYLALNPNGLVPTVKDGDLVLWESNTICRYLATTHRGERLYPAAPAARALVERWMDWQLANVGPPMSALLVGLIRSRPEERDPAAIEAARRKALSAWTIVEDELENRPYPSRLGADFGRDRAGDHGLSLARLSDRAAAAEEPQSLASADARTSRLQDLHRNPDHVIVSVLLEYCLASEVG